MHPSQITLPLLAAAAPASGETSGTIGGLLLFVTVALGFSFLCSLLEAGLLSTSASYIETQLQSGSRAARYMQQHKQNVEAPITAILTLNTIAHTVGAAGAGAQAVGVFGSQWFGVISAVLTFLILAFSEIIPKTLGTLYWKQLFSFTAYSIHFLVIVMYPAVWVFRAMTHLLMPDEASPTVTRGELETMARIGAREGTLKESESRILRSLLHLNDIQVYDVMTPRTVMQALQQDMTVGEVVKLYRALAYSRIPIYDDNVDDIQGFVLRHDLLQQAADDKHDTPLKALMLPLHSVPETLTVAKVLDQFMQRQEHIFLVFDEYGGTSGIITLEDAVESLLGAEITDESDLVVDTRKLAQQRYLRQSALFAPKAAPASGVAGETGESR